MMALKTNSRTRRTRKRMNEQPTTAYFSMEIALEAKMPTYSGGLGVLAGDTIRPAKA